MCVNAVLVFTLHVMPVWKVNVPWTFRDRCFVCVPDVQTALHVRKKEMVIEVNNNYNKQN